MRRRNPDQTKGFKLLAETPQTLVTVLSAIFNIPKTTQNASAHVRRESIKLAAHIALPVGDLL
jgi:hypothetical protein